MIKKIIWTKRKFVSFKSFIHYSNLLKLVSHYNEGKRWIIRYISLPFFILEYFGEKIFHLSDLAKITTKRYSKVRITSNYERITNKRDTITHIF